MAEDLGDKTEQPTSKRRSDARGKGQVAKSADLSAASTVAAIVGAMYLFTDGLLVQATDLLRYGLGESVLGSITLNRVKYDAMINGQQVVRMVLPIMVIMAGIALMTSIAQVGWKISPEAIKPKLDKFNIIKGAKKLFGKRAAIKGGLDLLKLGVIGSVALLIIHDAYDEVIALSGLPIKEGVMVAAALALRAAIWVLVILLILGFVDFAYQRWQTSQDLKMTKHEVKDERKGSEGDLDIKRRRMMLARQIAMQRVAIDVPKADVIVTNPTHYSVAIEYKTTGDMNAPRVVAKGVDYMAMKIRYIALAHGIPIVERAPLARALYSEINIGQEVHPEHYEAVAEVLAFVYRLDRTMAPQPEEVLT